MSEEEKTRVAALRRLPLRAIIAIAVRHAQRLRPEFNLPESTPQRERHMTAVSDAIRLAKQFVEGYEPSDDILDVANKACAAAAEAPENMFGVPATAAGSTAALVYDALNGPTELFPIRACKIIPRLPYIGGEEADRDYQKLLALDLGTFPDLGAPIDLSNRGPLGPLYEKHELN